MNLMAIVKTCLGWVNPRLLAKGEKFLRALPGVRSAIEKEYDGLLGTLEGTLKPYRNDFASFARLPPKGRAPEEVIRELEALKTREEARWKDGFVSGGVYHCDETVVNFLNRVYALHSQCNPLHADIWPSASKFEAEIVAMTANMLGAAQATDDVCGCVTSGGTESILLAMKTYRDWARERKGIRRPE